MNIFSSEFKKCALGSYSKRKALTSLLCGKGVKPSYVSVSFGDIFDMEYGNIAFDLSVGDTVFVYSLGNLRMGKVCFTREASCVDTEPYSRILSVVDTDFPENMPALDADLLVSFDREALSWRKLGGLFNPSPCYKSKYMNDDYDKEYRLSELKEKYRGRTIFERGARYLESGRVVGLSLDGERGFAVVRGSYKNPIHDTFHEERSIFGYDYHEVEFVYRDGIAKNFVCGCDCASYNCKHSYAVMLKLERCLSAISSEYSEEYGKMDYFAAVSSEYLFFVRRLFI